jgi:hypothetical protein
MSDNHTGTSDRLARLARAAADAPEIARAWRSPDGNIVIDRDPARDRFAINVWSQAGPQVLRLTGAQVRVLAALLTPDLIGPREE